jgi:hypothetical protein
MLITKKTNACKIFHRFKRSEIRRVSWPTSSRYFKLFGYVYNACTLSLIRQFSTQFMLLILIKITTFEMSVVFISAWATIPYVDIILSMGQGHLYCHLSSISLSLHSTL